MIDLEDDSEEEGGAPAWMATFADLMSLLVCFFVLLLSFSEMDLEKYRMIAGSLREAFGVQSRIEAQAIPKGTSVIAKEFSPGTPRPTPIPEIRQQTTNDSRHSLKVGSATDDISDRDANRDIPEAVLREKLEELMSKSAEAALLSELLKNGLADGKIDIEASMNQITVRIREQGSFASGQAILNPELLPLVEKLRDALTQIAGTISIEGHTDDVPITSPVFESNWDLSAARALSVARELLRDDVLDESRFMVVGRADTRPLRANDSPENRAVNRRVEIVVRTEPHSANEFLPRIESTALDEFGDG